ncbi:MAG: homocysteine S-methyltransferase family protein [Planctomycetota bacterium]|jgi:methylenetetrahydrofolate dehydrogenase (NADP+)/methenyltetrahydrofolate cyclohydrolase|nr:homocysteine S-methyltransferase family protein [Planctomycetota bacterium]
MTAQVIDGKAVAKHRRDALRGTIADLQAGGIHPCLAAITVDGDPAWGVYSKRQARSCELLSIVYRREQLPAGSTQEDLTERIEMLNADASVHGIIIQAPLQEPFDLFAAQSLISPAKDVEGVNPANLGLVLAGRAGIAPCTARSAFALAEHAMGDLRGVEAVVVGASVIVGKPVAQLLLAAGATVHICHIDTVDVASHTSKADLVVVAVGKAGLVTGAMLKPGAVVVDVGINSISDADGTRIVGDVDPDAWDVAGHITPVPGGVGALTTTILLEHTVRAAEALRDQVPAFEGGALTRILGGAGIDLPPDVADRLAGLLSRHLVTGVSAMPHRSALERRLDRGCLVLDGGITSALVARGVDATCPPRANLDAPDVVQAVHEDFIAAGAEAITTNTFHLNRYDHDREECARLVRAAVRLARHAGRGRVMVLGSIGPLGKVVGVELAIEEAEEAYAELAMEMADAGVDGVILETFPSTADLAAAVRAVRRSTSLPVIACRRYQGVDHDEMAEFALAMERDGATAIGLNCVGGPRALLPAVSLLAGLTDLPVVAQPNAGYPRRDADGRLSYSLRPAWLARMGEAYVAAGVRVIGGCCGVAPEHIAALADTVSGAVPGTPREMGSAEIRAARAAAAHPLLDAMANDAFPILTLIAGRCEIGSAAQAAGELGHAGAAAIGLDPGWPGSARLGELPAQLHHVQDRAGVPGILALEAGSLSLIEAESLLRAAHLLDIRLVLIDAGIFAGGREGGGSETEQLLSLIGRLNAGRDARGSRIDGYTDFTVGVRLPEEAMSRASTFAAAGAAFCTVQPVYEPSRFKAAVAAYDADIPLLAEVLVLPDADTAEELDNEVPALSVPERLRQRLCSDPDEDVAGVLRFLGAYRHRLAGACLLLPDARTDAAVQVLTAVPALT